MELTFLGQAGFLISSNNKLILIDPYLTNNVAKFEPKNVRRQPINVDYLNIQPDYILITHCHLDHYDKETLKVYFKNKKGIKVICPKSVFDDIPSLSKDNNYVLIDVKQIYKDEIIKVTGIKAKHSDPFSLGYLLQIENKKLYFTGDTLFDETILETEEIHNVDLLGLPINGVGNNMNVDQANKFAKSINPKIAIPIHWGMFDDINPKTFEYENRLILDIYKTMEL